MMMAMIMFCAITMSTIRMMSMLMNYCKTLFATTFVVNSPMHRNITHLLLHLKL